MVLDYSFWSRRSRDEYRALVRSRGVEPETVYLATSRDVVIDRMRHRRTEHADDFVLPDELVAENFDHFEAPTADEGPLTVLEPHAATIRTSRETHA